MADDAPADKPHAPATFTSFINKNASGKKFAPKAARRRPPAAAPKPVAPVPDHAESSAVDLPALSPSPPAAQTPADDNESARSPKRRRIDSPPPPPPQAAPVVPVAVMVPPLQPAGRPPPEPSAAAPPPTETEPRAAAPPPTEIEPSAAADPSAGTPTQTEPPTRRRRTLPWTAVNHPHDHGDEQDGEQDNGDEQDGEQDNGDEQDGQPTQRRPSARARGKRRANAPETALDGQPLQPLHPPPKKPPRSSKAKGKQPVAEGAEAETVEAAKPKRKQKTKSTPAADGETVEAAKPKRKRTKSTPAAADDSSVEPKRRGRPPREDTPSDAEDNVIDPDAMCMDDLASRNIRVGKLSRREKEMRKIDWDAVKQRRREEDARHITTKEAQAAVDKLLETGEVEQAATGPRYHVVDGRIELVQDSATIDRERDADRQIELMTITEEDDLTTRITSRSFMKNNKRFPNDFVLPGQGKRWNPQSTDMFYQGLRSFGTDFQMIAHMFPGMTRRSIKTKFTREERENPNVIRDCLRGESQLATHWHHFLEASQLQEDSFADADLIKRELADEELRMREQINEALRDKEERDKQRKLAGVTDDADADKDNAKRKKKRALKDKNVTFQEDGVEILGDVDDDPNWGQGG